MTLHKTHPDDTVAASRTAVPRRIASRIGSATAAATLASALSVAPAFAMRSPDPGLPNVGRTIEVVPVQVPATGTAGEIGVQPLQVAAGGLGGLVLAGAGTAIVITRRRHRANPA